MKKTIIGFGLKKSFMKLLSVRGIVLFLMCFMVLALPVNTFAQQPQKTVTGTVLDPDGAPLLGVTVLVKGTTIGTITDVNGNFSLSVPDDAATLVFSFVGMETQEVPIGTQTRFNVFLRESEIGLAEVVVVGYGSQKKESIVGAIVQTTSEELQRTGGVTNLAQALTGQLAGVTTIQSTGEPGEDDPRIIIRAQGTWNNSQPLILVDGVERKMNDLDISEVATISVLKDASATAVFGVKGSEGVILITTKRGRVGKPQMALDFNSNLKSLSKFPDRLSSYDAFIYRNNSIEYELPVEESGWGYYQPLEIAEKFRDPYGKTQGVDNYLIYPNVDWKKHMFKDYAMSYRANFNISGGSNFARYFGSLAYTHEADIMGTGLENNKPYKSAWEYNRFNYRTNLDFDITRTTLLTVNLSGYVGLKTDSYNVTSQGSGNATIFNELYLTPPNVFPLRFPDGEWGFNPNVNTGNLVATLTETGLEKKTRTQVSTDFALTQKLDFITEGLSAQASFSYDTRFTTVGGVFDLSGNWKKKWIDPAIEYMTPGQTVNDYTWGSNRDYGAQDYDYIVTPVSFLAENFGSISGTGLDYWNVGYEPPYRRTFYQFKLNYARIFGKHDVGATALMNREEYAQGSMFPAYREDWVGRLTYNYDQRYLFETNAAYNGSEKFSSKYRFGFFPSVALGWNISNEEFMKFDWLNKLKVRYSIGKVGNDNFAAQRWAYVTSWATDDATRFGLNHIASIYTQWKQTVVGNPDLHWEASLKSDLGIEVAVLNNRINLVLDFFRDNRTDIFLSAASRNVPQFFGANPVAANLGETKTHGYEIELRLQNTSKSGLYYWGAWTFAHAIDEVIFMEDPVLLPEYQKKEGFQIDQSRSQVSNGYRNNWDEIYASVPYNVGTGLKLPGDLNMVDFNGDGILDANDSAPVSYPTNRPQNTYNFSAGADYKGLSVMVQFYGVYNVDRFYNQNLTRPFCDRYESIVLTEYLDQWSPDNLNARYAPMRFKSYTNSWPLGETWRVDGSYLRLKTAEIAYTFSKGLIKKAGLNSLKIYLNGNNLIIWSKMLDDREETPGSNQNYPLFRRYNLGLNVTF